MAINTSKVHVDFTDCAIKYFDNEAVARYIERAVAQFNGHDGWMCMIAMHHAKPQLEKWFQPDDADVSALVSWAEDENKERNIYMAWALYPKKEVRRNPLLTAAFVADWDGATPRDLPAGKPTIIVGTSPGRWQHVYVHEPVAVDAAKATYRALRLQLQCNQGESSNASGLWRVPGTVNWPKPTKRRAPGPSILRSVNGVHSFEALLGNAPSRAAPEVTPGGLDPAWMEEREGAPLAKKVERWLEEKIEEDEGRFRHLYKIVLWMAEKGYGVPNIVRAVTPWCELCGKFVGREEAEVIRCIEKGVRENGLELDGAADGKPVSEDALALRFTERHGDELRYVSSWGHWMKWTGDVWVQESTLQAFDLARVICRQAKVGNAKTIAAVERLAKADRRHAATSDQWDTDPWSLNTPGGVVDLHTGEIRPHQPGGYMTKITTVAPQDMPTPLWSAFLERVTEEDDEVQDYLQRVFGYSLTGITDEHAMFFAYGIGRNGKGTCLNTVTSIMGDYAVVAPIETFTASFGDRHPTELAMLRGARLVTSQETEQGRHWAENRIKALTGGDPITARFMRQDFFTFQPAFKLFVAGNNKPSLHSVDEAISARMNMVPFNVTIPREERDPKLPEKLRDEWPGILAWMIEGCVKWQQCGLAPPAAVRRATADYLAAEDSFALWIAEKCLVGPTYVGTSNSLYLSWRYWADRRREAPGSQKAFSEKLQKKGYKLHLSSGRKYLGIAVRSDG